MSETATPSSPTLRYIEQEFGKKLTTAEMYEGAAKVDPYIWHCIYRRIKGQASTFNLYQKFAQQSTEGKHPTKGDLLRHRPFLIDPLRDAAQIKAYMKGRQVGVSEIMISEEVWFLSTHPQKKWMHTFHRKESAEDFSNTRISEALAETERIRALLGTPNQVGTKKIGEGYLFIRSTHNPGMGEGVDIDGITFDEVDRMRRGVEDAFKEGLESSSYGLIRYVSTPSIPGRGIAKHWERSDKKHWFVRCQKCNKAQAIRFPDNYIQVKELQKGMDVAVEGTWMFLCDRPDCRGMLDRLRGEWVAEFPGVTEISGYHMPQAIFLNHTATSIMNKRARVEHISLWDNYVLGVPSQSMAEILTDTHIDRCCVNFEWPVVRRTRDWYNICVGVDWGNANWVVVTGRNTHTNHSYVLNAFKVDDTGESLESAREIISRLHAYDPDMVVADAGYGKDRNPLLQEAFGDRFWICRYNPASTKKQTSLDTKWTEGNRVVLIDRTTTLKTMCNHIKLGRLGFPAQQTQDSLNLRAHLLALRPMIHEENGEVWETIEASGPDHLAHALGYGLLALQKLEELSTFEFSFMTAR